ncbi:MAG: filamentation induced by cAMP protein Fic [Bacteroidetes bacterium]|nr:filamentation induced by cAMP protein Fic [Bacteroidota bacterium]
MLDIVAVLTDQNDYTKTRNYWKYLKAKLKKENSQVVSATTQLKFLAPDGKKRLADTLKQIEAMPETTFDEIVNKYVEMNIAHPFMEGNGRSARIWLDLILKKRLEKCVDWSKIGKSDYMNAMMQSPRNSKVLKKHLENALTDKINDREMFMKGIDYSYYYEEND